jgi:hypothetical protein
MRPALETRAARADGGAPADRPIRPPGTGRPAPERGFAFYRLAAERRASAAIFRFATSVSRM